MRPWNQLSSMPRMQPFQHRAAADVVEVGEDLLGEALHRVGELLDEPRAAERIGDVGDVGLVGDDLLGAQGDARRLLRRQRHRLVHRVGVQALRAAEHAGQRLDRRAHDVDLRLLRRQRDTRRLGVEAQHHRALVGRSVAITHPPGPDPPRRPVLGDLLEEVDVGVEEEAQPRREGVDREAALHRQLDVGEAVGQRERQLLGGRRPGLADVVAGDRDRVPPRHLGGGEADRVTHQPHRRPRREHELLLRLVLLQDVVLQRAPRAGRGAPRPSRPGRRTSP